MAIDFIILFLLIISLIINCLALAAFWVTPGLRTTGNRFVINLLIINIFGCIALAPTLLLRSNEYKYEKLNDKLIINNNNNEILLKNSNNKLNNINNKKLNIKEALLKCNNNIECEEITSEIYKNNDNYDELLDTTIVITEMDILVNNDKKIYDDVDQGKINIPTISNNLIKFNDKNQLDNNVLLKNFEKNNKLIKEFNIKEQNFEVNKNNNNDNIIKEEEEEKDNLNLISNKNVILNEPQIENNIRCWSIDLIAALGALSVLLVVTDTWCAVTDPLRYHSRISGLKAWILIGITWILGIFFGILSALRETTITTKEITLKSDNISEILITEQDSLYTMIYSCIYFIIIILLPFGFVCFMYWRIFTEARENGLRMRQNGSSPLLQSALNLTSHNNHQILNNCNNNQNHKDPHHLSINYNNNNNINNNNSNSSMINLNKNHHGSTSDGLQMRIDHNDKNGTIKPQLLIPLVNNNNKNLITNHDRNQNILLTLSAATNNDIKRNYSTRQLAVLGSSQDLIDFPNKNVIRQVHSTPNLQKYNRNNSNGSLDEIIHNQHGLLHHNGLRLPQEIHHQNTPPKALSYMTSIRHRLSNASSLFKYREESRAARISILVVIMFLVSYLPYGILVLLEGRLFNLTQHGTQLSIFVVILGNISSPIIFAYRNKRVRRGVKRIFNLDPRAKDRHLQRHGIISQYNQNGLIKTQIKSTKGLNVKHNKNKISTYTLNTNSCKYLTPHSVVGTFLIDLEKCHHLTNDLTIESKNGIKINCNIDENDYDDDDDDDDEDLSDKSAVISINGTFAGNNSDSIAEKRSLLKIVCDSSKKLGCANGQSCTSSDCEIEPTDV